MARPKNKTRKDKVLRLLVNAEQEKLLKASASSKGLSLSSWLLSVGLEAAKAQAA